MDEKRKAELLKEIKDHRIKMESDENRLFRIAKSIGEISISDIRLQILDIDANGDRGGTEYMVEHRFSFCLTESKEEFIKKALKPYDIIESNMVINHG